MADLDDLRTFIAAARLGSFAAAARQINLSPAMVGRRIQGLEQRYGLKLIERTTRTQRITEQGRQFLERAELVLDAAEALEACADDNRALGGRLRISAPATLGVKRLPAIIARFTTENPGVVVELSLANRTVDLVGEGYDLAVRVGELASSSLVARRLGTYRFVCCAAPRFLARHGALAHPSQLSQARCVLNLNFAHRNRWRFLQADQDELIVDVGGGIETDNDEAQRQLTRDGAGVAYLPWDSVAEDLEGGALVQLFGDWMLPSMPIHAVHPSRSLVPRRVSRFIEALVVDFGHAENVQACRPLLRKS